MRILTVTLFLLFLSSSFAIWQKLTFSKWLNEGRQQIRNTTPPVSNVDQNSLPPLLRSYLEKVVLAPQEGRVVQFEQVGLFRSKPEEEFSNFTAQQIVSTVEPMFSWEANIKMGGLPFVVCDRLIQGEGELQARLLGVVSVAKASGPDFLRGELLRYLAELPWYPHAILNLEEISWKQTSAQQLEAEISMNSVNAKIQYTFNNEGMIESIYVEDREMSVGDKVVKTPWLGEFFEYKQSDQLLIPQQAQVSWILPEGKFTYFKGELKNYTPLSH